MQLELIDQTEKTIKIGIKDADTTLITPINNNCNNCCYHSIGCYICSLV